MDAASSFHLLVIEDDDGARANLRDILELEGYRVDTVGTMEEATRRTDWAEIGAIVLDRRLPDGSADNWLPRLKQLAPSAPVIVVTGYSDLEGAIAALRFGAADYLLKPIDPKQLINRLGGIAAQKRLTLALEDARRRALQAERLAAIGEVYTGLAHESRNALQRSQACLQRLANRVAEIPEALDLIARIQDAQDHLHRLYEEVRNYAAPLNFLDRRPCHLDKLLRQTWEQLHELRQDRQTALHSDAGVLDLECYVDRHCIGQVFRNILENSLSACADPVEISTNWSEAKLHSQSAVQIAIHDNGPGFTAESRARVFEPFYTSKTRGTGLGMSIAKRIVEAHGGDIAVGQHSGPGAEIVVTLPRRIP